MKHLLFSSKIFKGSKYGEGHPLNIDRVWPSLELLKKMKWINEDEVIFNDIASIDDLLLFHDENYIKALQYAEKHQNLPHHLKLKYKIGIGNNPIFKDVFSRPASAANSSITAVEYLFKDKSDKILNFSGGTHHGRSSFASGFCFLNDCILAIIKAIRLGFKKILYIDIDAHHCDAVQDYFVDEKNVYLISVHEKMRWPKTGLLSDCIHENILNVPVPENLNDKEMHMIFKNLIFPYSITFNPDLTIIQAGTDCLDGDPQSKMRLSNNMYWYLLSELKKISKKTLILGGGGYNPYITAKAWAGNWLVLNNKEHLLNSDLNIECKKLLCSLKWNNVRVKNGIPKNWLHSWRDPKQKNNVRYEIFKLIDAVFEYKNKSKFFTNNFIH